MELEIGDDPSETRTMTTLCIKLSWGKESYDIDIDLEDTFSDFQALIYQLTGVNPQKQKLFLKFEGKPPNPELPLAKLSLKPNQKILLVGLPDAQQVQNPNSATNQNKTPDINSQLATSNYQTLVFNDLEDLDADWDYEVSVATGETEIFQVEQLTKVKRRLEGLLRDKSIHFMNNPREPKVKPLLVLDLDHTLLHFSTKLVNTSSHESILRPHLHDFLARMYNYYEICIWSHTKWNWVEIKLVELNIVNNPRYQVCFALDTSHMFTVKTKPIKVGNVEANAKSNRGKNSSSNPRKHKVKPLDFIWAKTHWSEKNTVHVDDLAKNFALNPKCGLRCSPYKRDDPTDTELLQLATYLETIASLYNDFTPLDHSKWRKLLQQTESV